MGYSEVFNIADRSNSSSYFCRSRLCEINRVNPGTRSGNGEYKRLSK